MHRERGVSPFEVYGGIIEDEDVIVVRVVPLNNIHRFGDLGQDTAVCEIAITLRTRADDNTSRLLPIRGSQPPIVCRHEVCNHQRSSFTFWLGNCGLGLGNPTMFLAIVCIEDSLIVGPEYSVALIDGDGGRFAHVLFCPGAKSVFLHKPRGKEGVLSVFDNAFMLVPIDILARRGICPLIAKFYHPTSGGGEGDRGCGVIPGLRIVLIKVLNEVLCLDILTNSSKVHLKFFTKTVFCVKTADSPRTPRIRWE